MNNSTLVMTMNVKAHANKQVLKLTHHDEQWRTIVNS
jgi:hypothetical protein